MGIQIEGTPEFQRGFDAVCPDVEGKDESPYARAHEARVNLTRQIMQSVIAETPYRNVNLEDDIWFAVHELEEQNGLPDGVTADDVYQMYLRVFHGGDDGTL